MSFREDLDKAISIRQMSNARDLDESSYFRVIVLNLSHSQEFFLRYDRQGLR